MSLSEQEQSLRGTYWRPKKDRPPFLAAKTVYQFSTFFLGQFEGSIEKMKEECDQVDEKGNPT